MKTLNVAKVVDDVMIRWNVSSHKGVTYLWVGKNEQEESERVFFDKAKAATAVENAAGVKIAELPVVKIRNKGYKTLRIVCESLGIDETQDCSYEEMQTRLIDLVKKIGPCVLERDTSL